MTQTQITAARCKVARQAPALTDLLRGVYGYDGVVCTDWGVTRDHEQMDRFGATPWGAEGLTEADIRQIIRAEGKEPHRR